ncbi:hypothetical protein MBRA_00942 [Methylobacterium brachiatum]|nr:hypothetical protein MBRA_00942 [Methylobacterium brachiatum]
MYRHASARKLGTQASDSPREQRRRERRLARDTKRAGPDIANLARDVAQMFKSRIGSLDLASESLALTGRRRASVTSDEEIEPDIGLELRDCATDMGLPDTECGRRLRHSAMTQDGAEKVEMTGVHHAPHA